MNAADVLQISYREEGLPNVAQTLWQWADKQPNVARVWTFSGGLGAGKTTLIRALCATLGVEDAVHSPTFSLINEYVSTRGTILHMDWYRLRSEDEAIDAGMEDALLREGTMCFVEWPEQAEGLLRLPHVRVEIETISENERALTASVNEK
jgi:tRNA threonylcarbamoyladenosine biosynthesis protein TsaE